MRSRSLLAVLALAAGVFADPPAAVPEAPAAPVELAPGAARATPPALCLEASADEVLRVCRAMLPVRPVEIDGSLIRRSRKGIVSSEHDYRLVMRRDEGLALLTVRLFPHGATNEIAAVTISRKTGERPVIRLTKTGSAEAMVVASPLERVLETDVTWLDLTFDFLWWRHAEYEAEREGESIHGQACKVILVKPDAPIEGLSAVRLWVDKKTGCLMQSEQVGPDGKSLRRFWGTRVKKFDGKWMPSVVEVETTGARNRTKITVENLREL